MTTKKLVMTELIQGQQNAHVIVNDALVRIDATTHAQVINQTTTAPPGSPSNGDAYIIGISPTGAWANFDHYFAVYQNGWIIIQPWVGFIFTDISDSAGAISNLYVFTVSPVTTSSAGTIKSWSIV